MLWTGIIVSQFCSEHRMDLFQKTHVGGSCLGCLWTNFLEAYWYGPFGCSLLIVKRFGQIFTSHFSFLELFVTLYELFSILVHIFVLF